MKLKISALILSLAISVSLLNVFCCAAVNPPVSLRFDINDDGVVDFKDATITAQKAAGWNPFAAYLSRADINGDGYYDLKDTVILFRLNLGLDTWESNSLMDTSFDWPEIAVDSEKAGKPFFSFTDIVKNTGKLKYFVFNSDYNETLPFNLELNVNGQSVTGLLPAGVDITALTPCFECDDIIYCDSKPVVSNESRFDFTKPVVFKVGEGATSYRFTVYLETLNTGIPSMSITTDDFSEINSKTETKTCNVFAGGGDFARYSDYSFVTNETVMQTGTVKNRGWSSWYMHPKKSFTLKLDKKVDFFGMGKNKEWVLAANYPDRSLIRNAVAAEFAHDVGMEYVMDVKFVDLWINGKYGGNYQLIEKIEVDKNRINITDFDENLAPEQMGYVLETAGHNRAEEFGTFTNGIDADRPSLWQKLNSYTTYDPISGDIFFSSLNFVTNTRPNIIYNIGKPSDKKLMAVSEEKRQDYIEYIYDYMNKTEAAIKTGNYTTASQYIDMDAMARWYIVEETTANTDSRMHCSCYMYKDGGGKLKMGPTWDFDIGIGNGQYSNEAQKNQTYLDDSSWFYYLTRMPQFKAKVKAIWNSSASGISNLDSFIVNTSKMMQKPQELNFSKWSITAPASYSYQKMTEQTPNYSGQISYLRSYLSSRISYMNNKLSNW